MPVTVERLESRVDRALHPQTPIFPLHLPGVSATAIALGDDFTCAIVTGGGVKCWGMLPMPVHNSPEDVDLGSGANVC